MERAYLSFTETNCFRNINRLCLSLKQDQCRPLMGLTLMYQKFPKLWCVLKQNVSKAGSEWLQRAKSQAPYASLLRLPQPSTSHGGLGKSNFFIVLGSWKPGIRAHKSGLWWGFCPWLADGCLFAGSPLGLSLCTRGEGDESSLVIYLLWAPQLWPHLP